MVSSYTVDDFLGGQIRLKQTRQGLRATSDAVLLAAAVQAKSGERILDVGAGNGVVGLCIGARVPNICLTAQEVQPSLCRLIRENAKLNNQKVSVVNEDIQATSSSLHGVQFDHVVTNPPFYTEQHKRYNNEQSQAYHQEIPLKEWLVYCLKHVRHRGTLTLVHRPEALPEMLDALMPKLGGIEIIPLLPKPEKIVKRIILRGIVGSRKPLVLRAGIVLHDPNNHWTEQAEDIMRKGVGLLL